ncbi:DUF4844 domain-containing protein [Rufibacter ruber]|uniref:DUF4844 domain-containing protein n=1 Tax=Rufibacter ruber TaxID=1783499 RepID=UPI0009420512|nr:DUF4844 domain-containing protein [Rufibacter ruber]
MTIPEKAISDLDLFKSASKFDQDTVRTFYPGLADPEVKPLLTDLINQSVDDFKEVAVSDQPTEKQFQEKISIGLSRFTPLQLDTEDRERVCAYYEELMDMVGLESSGGILNNWMYGFDPAP